jgi:hypothetical protein
MNKCILIIAIMLGTYSCYQKSNASKDAVGSATDTVEDGNSTVDIDISTASTFDTTEYLGKMSALAHDSVIDHRPEIKVIPEKGAILPYHRVIAMYGNFYSKNMGILGRVSEEALIKLLEAEVKSWEKADTLTKVLPAIHYIAITAQNKPGSGKKYRLRMPPAQVQKAIDLARKIKGITFLDVQVGHSTVDAEVPTLEKYLINPDVHLGIDPEWSMKNGEVPGKKIGTMDAKDINFAIGYLSDLVKAHDLPPKILVVHRFNNGMVTNYEKIKPTPQVQVVINMDGFGFPAKKRDSYRRFVGGKLVQFTGFKLFYKNDKLNPPYRLMTPAEILKLNPKPIYIQYQ